MPNEIYHRSEWGNPKAEGFGDVYFDASATNKLYNHSDYYENSDGTDKILRDIPNKASIVLTPTAYSDGSLNTVIPPYQVLPQELVTNGNFDTDSDWSKGTGWSISGGKANADATFDNLGQTGYSFVINKTYKVTYEVKNYVNGNIRFQLTGGATLNGNTINSNGIYTQYVKAIANHTNFRFRGTNFTGSIDNVSVKEIQEADFDFSRGSSATRVNEKGLIEDVQILSGNLVQNGDFEEIGSELVTNGDFATDSDWTLTGATISQGKLNVNSSSPVYIVQNNVATVGKQYKVELTVSNYVEGDLRLRYPFTISETEFTGNGTYVFYGTADDARFELQGRFSGQTYNYSIDNVSVKEVGQNWYLGGSPYDTSSSFALNSLSQAVLSAVSGRGRIVQAYSFTSGKKYRVKYDVISTSNTGGTGVVDLKFCVSTNQQLVSETVINNTTNTVGTFTKDFTATSNLNYFGFIQDNQFIQGFEVVLDNISVIEITDDTDIPRIDYTSGQGALLLEPQSTNLVTYSEDLTQGLLNRILITSNVGTSPNGTNNADKLIPNNTNSAYHYFAFSSLTIATNNVYSVFLKKAEYQYALISFETSGTSGSSDKALINLNNGTIEQSDTETKVENYGNGWYRCSIKATSSRTSVAIYPLPSAGLGSFTGDNASGILAWGVQAEQKSFATSYIKTEGSTVTRSADVANNSGNADLFNDSEGVLYAEISSLANYNLQRWISISDNTHANTVKLGLYNNATNFRFAAEIRTGGTRQALITYDFGAITPTMTKIAVKYKENDFALWINGVEVATDTSGNIPIGLSSLQFNRGSSAQDFEGNVKSVAVFKEALTDAELQKLTS